MTRSVACSRALDASTRWTRETPAVRKMSNMARLLVKATLSERVAVRLPRCHGVIATRVLDWVLHRLEAQSHSGRRQGYSEAAHRQKKQKSPVLGLRAQSHSGGTLYTLCTRYPTHTGACLTGWAVRWYHVHA